MKKQNRMYIRWILVAFFVLAAGCFYGCGREEDQAVRLSGESRTEGLVSLLPGGEDPRTQGIPGSIAGQSAGVQEVPESGAGQAAGARGMQEGASGQTVGIRGDGQTREEEPGVCYVHVCGEVVSPGVYQLYEGQRIYEAVEAAGGFTSRASRTWLNLAEKVQDGMKLEVPDLDTAAELASSREAWGTAGKGRAGESSPGTGDGRININTATREELMRLTGIGEARAEDIISYRQEKGYFQTIEDIMKVPGIKNAAFQKIKDDIVV